MTDEVSIIGRVDVDFDGLVKLGDHAAIVPAEPVEAVFVRRDDLNQQRVAVVHAFTASGTALVLGRRGLVPAFSAAGPQEDFDHVRSRHIGPGPAAGPFTPAPPGLVAVVGETSLPILFFDRHGRPVLIDNEPLGRALYLAEEDEQLVRITGRPSAWPSGAALDDG